MKDDNKKTLIIVGVALAAIVIVSVGIIMANKVFYKYGNENRILDEGQGIVINDIPDADVHWLAIGDSITFGEDNNHKSYADYLSETYNISMEKRSWGGLDIVRLCELADDNFLETDEQPNVVTVLIGANDFGFNLPLEEVDSHMSKYMDILKEHFPEAHIIFLTPLYRDYFGNTLPTMGGQVNDLGVTLYQYKDSIINRAKKHEVAVVNLTNDEFLNADNIHEYTSDGLHPNEAGNRMIADKLYNIIFNKQEH